MRGMRTSAMTGPHAPQLGCVRAPLGIAAGSLLVLLPMAMLGGCSQQPQSPQATKVSQASNHPPVIHSVTIVPTMAVLDQPISVQVKADDLEGDLITFRHQWRVNGAPLANETHSTLGSKTLKRGDLLSIQEELITTAPKYWRGGAA